MAELSSPILQQKPPLQVHFVGSLPLSSSTEVFQRLATTFPSRILRIPDGEAGIRQQFTTWQMSVFSKAPWIMKDFGQPKVNAPEPNTPITLNPVQYDDVALSSYADFCKLRDQGIIPSGIRFQVCLPTPINVVIPLINPKYQAEVEPLYEKALFAALKRIQDKIPKKDLAIQWDAGIEFALIEGFEHPLLSKVWFSPLKEGLKERFAKLAVAVDEGVEVGFHLCYGDLGHKHFVEPTDAGHLVEMANAIPNLAPRDINWIHMPVPKNRTDDAYYAPLKGLELGKETKLYLGLAHANDLDGTRKRIDTASKVLENFGIATECGFGRAPKDEFEAVMEVLATVSEGSVV